MPKNIIDFDTVREIGLAMPGVEASVAYGTPILKLYGKIMAGIAINRSAERGSLMVRLDNDDCAELLAAAPEVYYVTDHYAGYGVLVRLSRVNRDVLRDLLGMAHKFMSRNGAARRPARKPKVRSKKRNKPFR